jgi:hypothetical protein
VTGYVIRFHVASESSRRLYTYPNGFTFHLYQYNYCGVHVLVRNVAENYLYQTSIPEMSWYADYVRFEYELCSDIYLQITCRPELLVR